MQTYDCWECEQRKPKEPPKLCAYSHHFKGICNERVTERVYRFDRWIPACRAHQDVLRAISPSQRHKPPKKRTANF